MENSKAFTASQGNRSSAMKVHSAGGSYLHEADFSRISEILNLMLFPCRVCPFVCGTDRRSSKGGRCKSGYLPKIASWNLHHGEEPPISGYRGSGTIFFSGCGLRCCFCQNYPISQLGNGREMTIGELADCMLQLQKRGAHNINFVTPTHFVPQAVEALGIAASKGLEIPIVYNSSGYENLQTLRLLQGIVDVYLPDMKYGDNECAMRYSGVENYVEVNRAAVMEMYRQVGALQMNNEGIAVHGVIIRHLVLPGNIENTRNVLQFIAGHLETVPISLMGQYFPAHRAHSVVEISRKLNRREYGAAVRFMEQLGLSEGWVQSL